MGKDHAIDYQEEKRLLGLFGATVVTTAQRMVEQNEHRYKELFFDYDPLTGEGAPGRRREIVIDDLYMGEEARLWLPIDMFSVGMVYWLEDPVRLHTFMGSQRVRHNCVTNTLTLRKQAREGLAEHTHE